MAYNAESRHRPADERGLDQADPAQALDEHPQRAVRDANQLVHLRRGPELVQVGEARLLDIGVHDGDERQLLVGCHDVVDQPLELRILERVALAAALADRVVVVLAARVGRLVAGGAVDVDARVLVEEFRNSNNPTLIDTLGWVYYKKNLHTAAVEQLRKAVSINETEARSLNVPASAAYHYHLGMALKGTGNKDEARRELQTAIERAEKAPFAEVEDAKKALATL